MGSSRLLVKYLLDVSIQLCPRNMDCVNSSRASSGRLWAKRACICLMVSMHVLKISEDKPVICTLCLMNHSFRTSLTLLSNNQLISNSVCESAYMCSVNGGRFFCDIMPCMVKTRSSSCVGETIIHRLGVSSFMTFSICG